MKQNFHNDEKWKYLQQTLEQQIYPTQMLESKVVHVFLLFKYVIDKYVLTSGHYHTISQQKNGGCWHRRVYPIPWPQPTDQAHSYGAAQHPTITWELNGTTAGSIRPHRTEHQTSRFRKLSADFFQMGKRINEGLEPEARWSLSVP